MYVPFFIFSFSDLSCHVVLPGHEFVLERVDSSFDIPGFMEGGC